MTKKNDNSHICAILAWFFPIGLIWYLVDDTMRKNKFVGFHVKQSLVLALASIIISAVGSIIPIVGWFIILPVGEILVIVLFIMGLIRAIKSEEKELPLIGKFAKHFKF